MSRRVDPIEAFLRYVETDQPYYDKNIIYPHLPKLRELSNHTRQSLRVGKRHLYHARERMHVHRHGVVPASKHISCSRQKGCKEFAETLTDPVFFRIDVDHVDWHVYAPDIYEHLYKERTDLRSRLLNVADRIFSELEYIVPYKQGLLKPVKSL